MMDLLAVASDAERWQSGWMHLTRNYNPSDVYKSALKSSDLAAMTAPHLGTQNLLQLVVS